MKKTLQVLILFVVVAVFVLFSIFFSSTKAQSPFIFGGFVTASKYCNCNNSFLLTIGPPVGGQFIFRIGTPQYLYKRLPSPGVWTLGLYSPGGACLMWFGKSCGPIGIPQGTITHTVGTSL